MIKLIVSDMDGTMLLPKKQQLEPGVLELVEKLVDAGYRSSQWKAICQLIQDVWKDSRPNQLYL